MVQGVVVQIAIEAFPANGPGPDRKTDIDRGIRPLLVLHLGLRQRGLGAGAPKDRLPALKNQVLFHYFGEYAKDDGFIGGIECQVRVFPIPEHSEPPKLAFLNIDVFACIRLGPFAYLQRRKALGFFDHLELDGQSMTIPTRE